jgi:hypothetical protein
MRNSLLARRLVDPIKLNHYWPGGEENTSKKLWGWIRCYAQLHAYTRRKDPGEVEQERLGKQAALLEALADQPEVVPLAARNRDGDHDAITVYPKSYVALDEIHMRNLALARLSDQVATIEAAGSSDDVDLLVRAYAEQTYLHRVIVWIATTPGPGLPYPERTQRPEPPEALGDLHPGDLYAIAAAFQRINVMRLTVLDATRKKESAPDWTVFFATLAGDKPTTDVMRDRSLSSVLASSAERARGREEAMAASKKASANDKAT